MRTMINVLSHYSYESLEALCLSEQGLISHGKNKVMRL